MRYYTYIISTKHNTVIYIGATNNLHRRVYEHSQGLIDGFTKKFNVRKLVYFEIFSQVKESILREKQIKKWSRSKKNNLITKTNPLWNDLLSEI